jgi:16S rRNA processing protein RimM
LHLENFWPHKEWMILKFQGIDSINDAEPLKGAEIQIPLEERAQLEEGATYVADLVGCRVYVRDSRPSTADAAVREVGAITDISFGAGEAPILEIRDGQKEYLVPLAQEYIRSLDTAAKRLELQLPEGMLELDAPLSAAEKQRQRQRDE